MSIPTYTTIPATTQQALISAAGSAKRASCGMGRSSTLSSMKTGLADINNAIEKLSAARNDIETLMRRAIEESK